MLQILNDFPLIANYKNSGKHFVYLDSAAATQVPQRALDAQREWYTALNATPHCGNYILSRSATGVVENARKVIANHIDAEKGSIFFFHNAADAIKAIAYNFALPMLRPGDEIVLSVAEHHNNIIPWLLIAKSAGARCVFLLTDRNGQICEKEIEEKITSRARIVAVSHVNHVLGSVFPIERIVQQARSVGAYTLVDASQSLIRGGLSVEKLSADFVVFSAETALAPGSIGVLWGRKELLRDIKNDRPSGVMVDEVSERSFKLLDPPTDLEEIASGADLCAFSVALQYLEELGDENVLSHELSLTERLLSGLREIPQLRIYGNPDAADDRRGIVSFNVIGQNPGLLASYLDRKGIAVRAGLLNAQPLWSYLGTTGVCRVSVGPYTQMDDVDYLLSCIQDVFLSIRDSAMSGR